LVSVSRGRFPTQLGVKRERETGTLLAHTVGTLDPLRAVVRIAAGEGTNAKSENNVAGPFAPAEPDHRARRQGLRALRALAACGGAWSIVV
jgi:hypothetical protein